MCTIIGTTIISNHQAFFPNMYRQSSAKILFGNFVVSIEFSPLSTVEFTTNWYQLHNGDYKGILSMLI